MVESGNLMLPSAKPPLGRAALDEKYLECRKLSDKFARSFEAETVSHMTYLYIKGVFKPNAKFIRRETGRGTALISFGDGKSYNFAHRDVVELSKTKAFNPPKKSGFMHQGEAPTSTFLFSARFLRHPSLPLKRTDSSFTTKTQSSIAETS